MSEILHWPIGLQCTNCLYIFSVELSEEGVWYGEMDGKTGDFWVCPNCEAAEAEFQEEEPRPTTTCWTCGNDFLDRDMTPRPDEGETCPGCTPKDADPENEG